MKRLQGLAVVVVLLVSMVAGVGEASAAPPLIRTCTKIRNNKAKVVGFLATCRIGRETSDTWELQSRVATYKACTSSMIHDEDVLDVQFPDAVANAISHCPLAWPGPYGSPPSYPTTPSAPSSITTCTNIKSKMTVSLTGTCKGKKVKDRWVNRLVYADYRACTHQFISDQSANQYWPFAVAYADVTSTCPVAWP